MNTKKIIKKTLYLILTMSILLCSFASPLFAASKDTAQVIQPRWANVESIVMHLGFDTPMVSIVISIAGQPNSTFTNGTVTLEKLTGTDAGTIYTWNNLSSNMPFFLFSDDSVPRTRGTYLLTITITTHGLNGTEVFTKDFTNTY